MNKSCCTKTFPEHWFALWLKYDPYKFIFGIRFIVQYARDDLSKRSYTLINGLNVITIWLCLTYPNDNLKLIVFNRKQLAMIEKINNLNDYLLWFRIISK